jgi:hypothetical protein
MRRTGFSGGAVAWEVELPTQPGISQIDCPEVGVFLEARDGWWNGNGVMMTRRLSSGSTRKAGYRMEALSRGNKPVSGLQREHTIPRPQHGSTL